MTKSRTLKNKKMFIRPARAFLKNLGQSFLALTLSASIGYSAPVPGAATSAAANPALGLYNSPHGFRISSGGTDWYITSPPPETRYIVTMYQGPKKNKDTHPSLTVRVDNLKKPISLNEYVQQWMRDYPKFGFVVLGSRAFNQSGTPGFVIDLKTKSADKQLRQVVFLRDRKAVILTCRDQMESFANTLKSCNNIIKTFAWNKLTAQELEEVNKIRVGPPSQAKPAAKDVAIDGGTEEPGTEKDDANEPRSTN